MDLKFRFKLKTSYELRFLMDEAEEGDLAYVESGNLIYRFSGSGWEIYRTAKDEEIP